MVHNPFPPFTLSNFVRSYGSAGDISCQRFIQAYARTASYLRITTSRQSNFLASLSQQPNCLLASILIEGFSTFVLLRLRPKVTALSAQLGLTAAKSSLQRSLSCTAANPIPLLHLRVTHASILSMAVGQLTIFSC